MEELQKALQKRGLSINDLPGKGRSLFTARDFQQGEVILREEPYVCVPSNPSTEPRCDGCFSATNLKKCSGCQVVWYCGSTCQKAEWKLHRLECQAFSRLEKGRRKLVTPTIRLMVKLYFFRKLQREKVLPATASYNNYLVEALVSHISDIEEKQLVLYAQMANLVNLILQLPGINIKEIAENFSKFACNVHTICDSELRPLGTGLYPIVSIINHSCLANAVLIFDGKVAVVRAVEDIPKASEVTISYIEIAGSTMTRQKTLREQYHFSCKCPRCSKLGLADDIEESAILEGYQCAGSTCSGFLLRDSDCRGFVCQECGLLRDKEEIRKKKIEVDKMLNEALTLSSNNRQEIIRFYKEVENLQMNLCHPHSIALMRTREKLLQLFMEVEGWTEALAYCRLVLPVYRRVYPRFHPLLGLQYYTCGKLEWFLGETDEAARSLMEAADILRVTHGTHTTFIKELLGKVDEAHAEASYKRYAVECPHP